MNESVIIRSAELIFWDFDGVIKDSVAVKTQAFVKLFAPYGSQTVERVRSHHEANGGMSRFEKLPLYLRWAGEEPTEDKVNNFSKQFSKMVLQEVIDAPWVPGAENYLRSNAHHQIFVLVSATPQDEIEEIVHALNLQKCFESVFGAPITKQEAIRKTLKHYNLFPKNCLMIGDARADMEAAEVNQVPFLLRRHATNGQVFKQYAGEFIEDFKDL